MPPRKDIREIRTWQDVDVALGILRRTEADLAIQNAGFDTRIQEIQAEKQATVQPHVDKADRIGALVEAFVQGHRDQLGEGKAKSRKLVHGTVGFKLGNRKVVYAASEATTMKLLKGRGLTEAIATKESVDKTVLLKLPTAELGLVGVRIEQDETFFYKLHTTDPIEYPDADGESS